MEDESPWKSQWEIVRDVRDITAQMRREIEVTLKKIRPPIVIDGGVVETPVDVSVSVATTGKPESRGGR